MAEQLSNEQMDALVDSLYAVLVLVAGADGVVDPKEEQRFAQLLAAAADRSEGILNTVIEKARVKAPAPGAQPALARDAALACLTKAAQVADSKLAADDASILKDGLYRMGKAIAESSGGGFLGLGKRTSKDETDALAMLAATLGLRS